MNLFTINVLIISVILFVALVRNFWVYNQLMYLSSADYQLYQRLPTYWVMYSRFWIWDAVKFIDYKESHVTFEKRVNAYRKKKGREISARFHQQTAQKEQGGI